MLRSSLCDYSDAYILVTGTITVTYTAAQDQPNYDANKKVIFKNCAPFTNCISRINNTKVDDAHDIDIVISMYNSIEYSDNYSKRSGILSQYCKDEPTLNPADHKIANLTADGANNGSPKIKEKTTGKTGGSR